MRKYFETRGLTTVAAAAAAVLCTTALTGCGGSSPLDPVNSLPGGVTDLGYKAYRATTTGAASTASGQDLLTAGFGLGLVRLDPGAIGLGALGLAPAHDAAHNRLPALGVARAPGGSGALAGFADARAGRGLACGSGVADLGVPAAVGRQAIAPGVARGLDVIERVGRLGDTALVRGAPPKRRALPARFTAKAAHPPPRAASAPLL